MSTYTQQYMCACYMHVLRSVYLYDVMLYKIELSCQVSLSLSSRFTCWQTGIHFVVSGLCFFPPAFFFSLRFLEVGITVRFSRSPVYRRARTLAGVQFQFFSVSEFCTAQQAVHIIHTYIYTYPWYIHKQSGYYIMPLCPEV